MYMLFWLIAAHFIIDFPLQGDTVALQKSPYTNNALSKQVPWYYWMTAHSLMHAAGVLMITGSLEMAALELWFHWSIDFGKCGKWYGIHVDQALHILCKLFYFWVTGGVYLRQSLDVLFR